MSLPLNPTNGQQVVLNGIKYNYNLGTNSWRRDFNNALDRLFLVGNNQAVSTSTGDLVVYGGAGFGKNVHVGGRLVVYNGADFNGTITGVISTSSVAISLAGGRLGDLLYQSSTGTTAFINIATTGSILLSDGVIPVWTTTAAISVAFASTATNINGGLATYIPFQSASGTTTFDANFRYNSQSLLVSNTTPSTGTTSGALIISGGAGIAGDVYVGGNFQVNGTTTFINSTNLEVTDKNVILSKGAINSAAADGAGFTVEGPVTQPTILYRSATDSWDLNKLLRASSAEITGGAASISTGTGALKITGGIGVHGAVHSTSFNGPLTGTVGASTKNTGGFTSVEITAVTSSTSVSTGALTVAGGAGIAGTVTANQLAIVSTAQSTSVSTGALTVAGGGGIAGNLFVGGLITGVVTNANNATTATLSLTSVKSNNISAGAANQIPYQSAADTTIFSNNLTFNGTTLSASQISVSSAASSVLPTAELGISLTSSAINQSPYIRLSGNASGVVMLSSFGTLRILQDGVSFTNSLLTVGPTGAAIPVVTNSVSTTTGSLVLGGGLGVGGSVNVFETVTAQNVTASGNLIATRHIHPVATITTATGLVVHDLNVASKFYHTGMTSNFTANFTNVPTTDGREINIELILNQNSSTGFFANIIQINGVGISARYNAAPVATANRIEIQKLRLIRISGSWIVLGQLEEYV
jgi:hypothetical protein